jgi:hypothetical protein
MFENIEYWAGGRVIPKVQENTIIHLNPDRIVTFILNTKAMALRITVIIRQVKAWIWSLHSKC